LTTRCSRTLLRREAHLAVRQETSEPGAQAQGRHGPAGALPGIRAEGLPRGGPAPQQPAP
jgi:hypothetical protein